MNTEEFKTTLLKINTDLKGKDEKKVTSDTFKVSFALSDISPSDLKIEDVSGYKVNLDESVVSVQFRFRKIENFVADIYGVTPKDFGEMKKIVFVDSLFRAYYQFLSQTVSANKEKLIPKTEITLEIPATAKTSKAKKTATA
jgi:hypothetical protein